MTVESFRLVVPGRPVAKGRPRMARGGHVYTPAATRAYEQQVRAAWLAAGRPELPPGPFALEALFVFERPPSHYRTKAQLLKATAPPVPREDTDNLLKGLADALNGLAFADDRLCAEIHAGKRWASGSLERARAVLALRASDALRLRLRDDRDLGAGTAEHHRQALVVVHDDVPVGDERPPEPLGAVDRGAA